MNEVRSEAGKNVAEVLVGVIGWVLAALAVGLIEDIVLDGERSALTLLAFFWVIPCVIATSFGVNKNRGVFGFILGFLFSWIGVVVIGCFKTRIKES